MNWFFMVLIVIGFCISPTAWGADCEKHKIYCKVVELRPNIDKSWAMKFSNIVYKKAKKYELDPMISIAIAMQESSLRQINRRQSVLVPKEACDEFGECVVEFEKIVGYSDLSIWQFHVETLEAYNIDPVEVHTNLEYATDFHFKLLKKKIKMCKHLGDEAWTCYHSATERFRKKYKDDVGRYLEGAD